MSFDPVQPSPDVFACVPAAALVAAEVTRKQTILIVDDAPTILNLVTGLLEREYNVRIAASGEAALSYMEKARPDLILLDVMMPDMDGFEVCTRLKANAETAQIPVIFLSAMSDSEDESIGLRLGASDYLFKPLNPLVLAARVHAQLQASALRRIRDCGALDVLAALPDLAKRAQDGGSQLDLARELTGELAQRLHAHDPAAERLLLETCRALDEVRACLELSS